ncbi:hypothetical protein MBLNU459_g1140t1 [Dothideomycetes sp. NU459]
MNTKEQSRQGYETLSGYADQRSNCTTDSFTSTSGVIGVRRVDRRYRESYNSGTDGVLGRETPSEQNTPRSSWTLSVTSSTVAVRNYNPEDSSPVKNAPSVVSTVPTEEGGHIAQPILKTITNSKRVSYGGNITQHKLLAPRQPPTPPAPLAINPAAKAQFLDWSTPSTSQLSALSAEEYGSGSYGGTRTDTVSHIGLSQAEAEIASSSPLVNEDQVSVSDHQSMMNSDTSFVYMSECSDQQQITAAQLAGYWGGRLSSTTDRLRNERYDSDYLSSATDHSSNERHLSGKQQMLIQSKEDDVARMRQALQYLYSVCATEDAKDSLRAFYISLLANHAARRSRGDQEAIATFISWADISGEKADEPKKQTTRFGRKKRATDPAVYGAEERAHAISSIGSAMIGGARRASFMEKFLLSKARKSDVHKSG